MDSYGEVARMPKAGTVSLLGSKCVGLGISDLKTLGWALRMRWFWLQKTEPDRPWADLTIHVPGQELFLQQLSTQKSVMVQQLFSGQTGGSMDKALQI